MQTILITFVVVVALRLLVERKLRQRLSVGAVVKDELTAWLLTMVVLVGAFLVVLCFTLIFGPIPPIHEWGSR